MTSQVEIANLALANLGNARGIDSFNEESAEAAVVSRFFNLSLERTLAEFPWPFATKSQTLALTTDSHPEWDYVYAYPNDCLSAQYIATEGLANLHGSWRELEMEWENRTPVHPARLRVRFQVALSPSGNGRVILTNEDDAILIYTAQVTDPTIYPPNFTEALVHRLAYDVCMPITADAQLKQAILEQYRLVVGAAKATAFNESEEGREPDAEFLRVRD